MWKFLEKKRISALRGKCTIRHTLQDTSRKATADLAHVPDAFVYSTLFDRYTRRTYTILPLQEIGNLPQTLLSCLRHARLSFILVEEGTEDN